jgi:hypothetical protein
VRNPQRGTREWEGAWGEGAPEWGEHPVVAHAAGYTGEASGDGCFWMSLDDFASTFNTMYMCRLLEAADGWLVERRESAWTPETAGGCVNSPTWVKNEQYALEVTADTELVVSVMQPDARYKQPYGPKWGVQDKAIGFLLCRHDYGGGGADFKRLTKFTRGDIVAFTEPFKPLRCVTVSAHVKAGKYVLIPMTFLPGGLGTYWITVYGKAKFTLLGGREVVWDEPVVEPDEVPAVVVEAAAHEVKVPEDSEAAALKCARAAARVRARGDDV